MNSDLTSKFQLPYQPRKLALRYTVAVTCVGLATGARWILTLKSDFSFSPFILFYPAVMYSAWYGGVGPGLLATSLSSLLGAFFFVFPAFSFETMGGSDFLQLILFVFVSLTICLLTGNLYKSLSDNSQKTEDLLRSRRRVKNILESIRGCFFSLDREERFIHINEDCKDYLPTFSKDLYGKNLWDVFANWQGTEFEQQLEQVRKTNSAVEFKFYDPGMPKCFEVHIGPSADGVSVHLFDITSREEAEKAVGESENRFRIMADQAPVLLWMSGTDTFCHYFNEPWLKFRGRTLEQEMGEGWTEGVHPDDLSDCMKDYLLAFNTRQSFRIEFRLKAADGQYRWVLNSGIPRFTSDKKFAGYIGSVVDITGRKQEEKRQITEFKIVQVLAQDISFRNAFLEILKIICEELDWEIGLTWEREKKNGSLLCKEIYSQDRIPAEEFIEKSRQMIYSPPLGLPGRIVHSGKSCWIQNVFQDPNFPRFPLAEKAGLHSAFGFPIRLGKEIFGVMEFYNPQIMEPDRQLLNLFDSIGNLIGQFMERKETEEALRQSQQNFTLALESARMGYWTWDLKTNQVNWSDNLAFLHGLSTETLTGTFESFLSCIHPDDRDFVQKSVMEAIESKSIYKTDFRTRWADGSLHWIHGRGRVLCDEEGALSQLIGLGIDITERKQSEKTLEMAYEYMEKMVEERTAQLARTNTALKAEMLERRKVEREILEISQEEQRRWGAQIHDDLCQNLTGIMLFTKALAQNVDRRGTLDSEELKRIEDLLNQSISQAKEMARGLYPVELPADSLMFALKDLANRSEAIFKVSCGFDCPDPILIEDNHLATHLYRIAQEAIHNAVKHGEARQIDIHLMENRGQISLIIQDEGKGFPAESNHVPGIGFQIMKYRARMIDATLEMKNHPPHGTILTCTFASPLQGELEKTKKEKAAKTS